MEQNLLQEAVNAVDQFGSVSLAAKELGLPRKTLSNRYNKAIDQGFTPGNPSLTIDQQISVDSKIRNVSQDKRNIEKKYSEALKIIEQQKQQLSSYESLQKEIDENGINKFNIVKRSEKESEVTPVLCYSDLHYEEVVDPLAINDLNEYNTNIATRRSYKFFENSVKLIEMCKSKSKIRSLVLWLGGDLINGYIHEEYLETNEMSPISASLDVFSLIISGIDFLLENSGAEEITVVCNVGNHARTTIKQRTSTNVYNSFEWLIYNFLQKHYKNHEQIKFKLSKGYFNILDIYGYKLRFHHGENVKYFGGVGGLTIPLNKAIQMWNEAQSIRADLDVLGHWHQRLSHKQFIVNGSIVGFNAYALKIKAQFEKPQQSFFVMHPKYGKTVECPILLD